SGGTNLVIYIYPDDERIVFIQKTNCQEELFRQDDKLSSRDLSAFIEEGNRDKIRHYHYCCSDLYRKYLSFLKNGWRVFTQIRRRRFCFSLYLTTRNFVEPEYRNIHAGIKNY